MKKHNRTPLLFLLLAVGAAALLLCGSRFQWFVLEETVIPPTCTEGGYTLRRLWFGIEKQTDPTDPLRHDYLTTTSDPTCQSGGSTLYVCTRCEESFISDYTNATGHRYESLIVPPTCTEPGYTKHTCVHGDHEYTDTPTQPLGHRYTFTVTLSTCETEGYTTYTCTVCSDTYRDHITPALKHQDNITVTLPTCTTPGFTLTVCARCNRAILDDPKEATGHHHTARVIAATCTTPGYTSYHCPDCGDSYTADETPILGHQYLSTFTPATTTTAGGTIHTCARCSDQYTTDVFTFREVFDGRQGDGNGIMFEGVDLSHHNGTVDFHALKAAGISFVILRVGTSNTADRMFETYYEQARAAGMHIGAYVYSYADSPEAALQDVSWLLPKLSGKQFEYPIFFDIEDSSLVHLDATTLTDITLTFCNAMVDAGYYPGIYTNKKWLTDHLEIDRIANIYDIWLASWVVTGENITDYSDAFSMWQYTDNGSLSGISTAVDRNGSYRDYPTYIKKYGYNGFGS